MPRTQVWILTWSEPPVNPVRRGLEPPVSRLRAPCGVSSPTLGSSDAASPPNTGQEPADVPREGTGGGAGPGGRTLGCSGSARRLWPGVDTGALRSDQASGRVGPWAWLAHTDTQAKAAARAGSRLEVGGLGGSQAPSSEPPAAVRLGPGGSAQPRGPASLPADGDGPHARGPGCSLSA